MNRFDVGSIGKFRIGHNRRWVGVDQNNFISELFECFGCLCTGVVKFTRLSYDDRTGADEQYFMYIFTFWHRFPWVIKLRYYSKLLL